MAGKPALLALAVLVTAGAFDDASACSRSRGGLVLPEPNRFALSGIVIGYTEARGAIRKVERARGLRVQLEDSPSGGPEEMHWYPLATAPDCSDLSFTIEELRQQYPLGEAVIVVARIVTSPTESARLVIVNSDDFGPIAHVPARQLSAAPGGFDFESVWREQSKATEARTTFSEQLAWRDFHRSAHEDYEFYRASLLLRQGNDAGRSAQLKRLSYYSRFRTLPLREAKQQYEQLVRWSGVPSSARNQLLREFEGTYRKVPEP